MEDIKNPIKINSQAEMDSFIYNYNNRMYENCDYITATIQASGSLVVKNKDTDMANVTLDFFDGQDADPTLDVTVDASIGIVDIYRNHTHVTCSNVIKVNAYQASDVSLDLTNVREVEIGNSTVTLSSIKNSCTKPTSFIINYSTVFVPEHGHMANTLVEISSGGTLTMVGGHLNNRFILTENGNLCVENGIISAAPSMICAFDYSTITVLEQEDIAQFQNYAQLFDHATVNTIYPMVKYDNILDYCEKNDIEHTNTYGYFYKIVKQQDDKFFANYDKDYEYKVGEWVYPTNGFSERCDDECAPGIHCGGLNYVLREYGHGENLAILKLRVEFDDFAPYTPGNFPKKLRCRKAFVEKAVNPNTLGIRQILLNR